MIRRHPHVFRDARAETPADVLVHWETTKSRERSPSEGSILDGLPHALPALQRAQRVQERASGLGFDWPDAAPVLAKLEEEVGELREALAAGDGAPEGARRERIAEELGDLFFAGVNLARLLGLNAEETLRAATAKFARRFRAVEKARAAAGGTMTLEEMDRVWDAEKRRERGG
jgi:ATP diphosphatase